MGIEDTSTNVLSNENPGAVDELATTGTTTAENPTDTPAETPEETAARQQKEAEAAAEADRKKRNRTSAFIDRMKTENHAMRQELAELRAKVTAPAAPSNEPAQGEPRLEQFNFDIEAFTRAHSRWVLDQDTKQREDARQQAEQRESARKVHETYTSRVDEFTEDHPDFVQVVSTGLPAELPASFQLAIAQHELGPAIAYHLAQNEDDLLDVLRLPPGLQARQLERIASRLRPAPQAASTTRSISQAPAPTPTVSARSPLNTPEERLTDDEWFERQRASKRDRQRR